MDEFSRIACIEGECGMSTNGELLVSHGRSVVKEIQTATGKVIMYKSDKVPTPEAIKKYHDELHELIARLLLDDYVERSDKTNSNKTVAS